MNYFFSLGILTTIFLTSCMDGNITANTDDEKTIYTMGVAMGQRSTSLGLSEREQKIMAQGFKDAVMGKDPQVKFEDYAKKISALVGTRTKKHIEEQKGVEQAKSKDFLAKMEKTPGAKKTESGLIFISTKEGTGASPKLEDKVKVHYHGTLIDGTVFDSSKDRGTPAEFPLGGVIKCWQEGVQLIKVGGSAKLICPSDIAYGDRGAPPKINPGATLVFEVDLLEINKVSKK